MGNEPTIYKALRQQLLWPALHTAIDVYQRRRSGKSDSYELIWRLIHVVECLVITIAAASISRVRKLENQEDLYLKLRERCYGLSWDATDSSLEKKNGALDGSIDKWIEILQVIASSDISGSEFLSATGQWLSGRADSAEENSIDLQAFVRAWERACETPKLSRTSSATVMEAFRAINSFRNRFAHVPFPYDQLQDIARELEACVFKLFEIGPSATGGGSCLSGCFAIREILLCGAGHANPPTGWGEVGKNETMVWGKNRAEIWDARPFVYIDKMMRPYMLSRLTNDAGAWEYTRYLAEANAVHTVSNPDLLTLLPRPAESEYPGDVDELDLDTQAPFSTSDQSVPSREDIFDLARRRDFEPVITFWQNEVNRNQGYHTGWLRLGVAQRELGVDKLDFDSDQAQQLFRAAVDSLGRAIHHKDPGQSGEAYYNRSKAHWRLGRLLKDDVSAADEQLSKAKEDANLAIEKADDSRFVSWLDFLSGVDFVVDLTTR